MRIRIRKIHSGKDTYLEIPDKVLEKEDGTLTMCPDIHVVYISKSVGSDVTIVIDSDFKIVGTTIFKQ